MSPDFPPKPSFSLDQRVDRLSWQNSFIVPKIPACNTDCADYSVNPDYRESETTEPDGKVYVHQFQERKRYLVPEGRAVIDRLDRLINKRMHVQPANIVSREIVDMQTGMSMKQDLRKMARGMFLYSVRAIDLNDSTIPIVTSVYFKNGLFQLGLKVIYPQEMYYILSMDGSILPDIFQASTKAAFGAHVELQQDKHGGLLVSNRVAGVSCTARVPRAVPQEQADLLEYYFTDPEPWLYDMNRFDPLEQMGFGIDIMPERER